MTRTAGEGLEVGLIGAGQIARSHVAALHAIAGVRVAAVADSVEDRAVAFAHEYGVARTYGDADALLRSGVDAVMVCTPNGAHEADVLAAAHHGVHVLCEKPIALSVDAADRMIAAAAAAGIRFGVVFQRRFWPAARRVRAAIDDGRLGPLTTGGVLVRLSRDAEYYSEPWRGRWATEGGGVLMTQAIHHIDLLQWFMGPARRVVARMATLVHGGYIEVEDTAAAVVEFATGAIATVQVASTFNPGLGARVWVSDIRGATAGLTEFPEGVGSIDSCTIPGEADFHDALSVRGAYDTPLAQIHRELLPYHAMQLEDFIKAVREDREPSVTGREAVKSLEIVQAIYASARSGAPVDLTRGDPLG